MGLKGMLSMRPTRMRWWKDHQSPSTCRFDDKGDSPPPPPPRCEPKWRCFSYEELRRATNGFHQDNMVGRGGYAEVYRGMLEDGRVVAVKRLIASAAAAAVAASASAEAEEEEEEEEKEEELGQKRRRRKVEELFLREVGTVVHVNHPNVCGLIGCCIESGLHLIFHFSSHGSVSSHLYEESMAPALLPWEVRYKIAVGTARGLQYLHRGCKRRIIHRDIKASNVLLTNDFEPQISDFGLAKWLPKEWTHRAVAPIEGTFGYLAPEYFTHGIIGEKTDVFAFGVFLLEVISGKKPVDASHQNLLSWAKPHLSHYNVQKLLDPRLGGNFDLQQLNRIAFAASLCIRSVAEDRPSMDEVLSTIVGDCDKVDVPDHWQMMTDEEEEEDLWGFNDLEDLDYDDTSLSSTSSRASS